MKKIRPLPAIKKFVQWFKDGDHPAVKSLARSQKESCTVKIGGATGYLETADGGVFVTPGDYIVTGEDGNLYLCNPNIFKRAYGQS